MHNQTVMEAQAINTKLGKRLRATRKAKGLSQSNLADATGVAFQQIGRCESGENTISTPALYCSVGCCALTREIC